MNTKIEFGDFQTPLLLANRCCDVIKHFYQPKTIIEPTCGLGAFIEASYNSFKNIINIYGFDINIDYINSFKIRCPFIYQKATIHQADFFQNDLTNIILNSESPLVIGNPPWVTNSQLGSLKSNNLPQKENIKKLSGFDSKSGKSNFDISEWMILKLLESIYAKKGVLAMLCKTQVARNVFLYNHNEGYKNISYKIFKIDSKKEFNVSVDACFLMIDCFNGGNENICKIYNNLDLESYEKNIGISNSKLISNIDLYLSTKDIVSGKSEKVWRSGIKHDASKVMEIIKIDEKYYNGFNELIEIEQEYLYPLLKSSDIANNRIQPQKYVIVTQTKVGEDTGHLKIDAPKLWHYLNKYSNELDNRKSSIYKNQFKFSLFGIGDYSFKPYKIAISGLYKKINFCLLKPFNNKPIMLDDTCYLIGFDDIREAEIYYNQLNSEVVFNYIDSLVFWDSKRPINVDVLKTVDIDKIRIFTDQFAIAK